MLEQSKLWIEHLPVGVEIAAAIAALRTALNFLLECEIAREETHPAEAAA